MNVLTSQDVMGNIAKYLDSKAYISLMQVSTNMMDLLSSLYSNSSVVNYRLGNKAISSNKELNAIKLKMIDLEAINFICPFVFVEHDVGIICEAGRMFKTSQVNITECMSKFTLTYSPLLFIRLYTETYRYNGIIPRSPDLLSLALDTAMKQNSFGLAWDILTRLAFGEDFEFTLAYNELLRLGWYQCIRHIIEDDNIKNRNIKPDYIIRFINEVEPVKHKSHKIIEYHTTFSFTYRNNHIIPYISSPLCQTVEKFVGESLPDTIPEALLYIQLRSYQDLYSPSAIPVFTHNIFPFLFTQSFREFFRDVKNIHRFSHDRSVIMSLCHHGILDRTIATELLIKENDPIVTYILLKYSKADPTVNNHGILLNKYPKESGLKIELRLNWIRLVQVFYEDGRLDMHKHEDQILKKISLCKYNFWVLINVYDKILDGTMGDKIPTITVDKKYYSEETESHRRHRRSHLSNVFSAEYACVPFRCRK